MSVQRLIPIGLVIACLLGGCAHQAPRRVQAGEGGPITAEVLEAAANELELAHASCAAGDPAGAEQAALRSARILYSVASPSNGEGSRYAELTSRLSLLTVRLNRILHDVSPDPDPERFTFPLRYNARIERQIDYYITRARKPFARWLRRSGRYVETLREYFLEENLPGDLVYLALVESGFNPRNRSPKQAVGLFQFIRGTADLVGLKQDYWVDERRDPDKAARAAIKHLKSLYREFQDWDLALAAYNAGSGRLRKAIKAQGTRDFWKLALPPETEAYVPKFYATLIIAREPELYGFNPDFENGDKKEEAEVPGGVDLKTIAEAIGVTVSVVADLNPELTKGCTPPGPEPYLVRVPRGTAETFTAVFAALPEERKYLSKEELARRKFKGVYVVYKIKPGDALYNIAKKHHTTVAKIQRWNPSVKRKKYIFPGQKLRIYRTR